MVRASFLYNSGAIEIYEYGSRRDVVTDMLRLLPRWNPQHEDRLVSVIIMESNPYLT